MVQAERASMAQPRGRSVPSWAQLSVAAAALALVALVLIQGKHDSAVELDFAPKMVKELEKEARKDVMDDATKAGLHALSSTHSLAATLTGGLKRQLQDMQVGDKALLNKITQSAKATAATDKQAKKVSKALRPEKEAAKVVHKQDSTNKGAGGKPPHANMDAVLSAVDRDRVHQMLEMSKELRKVSELKKKVAKMSKATHNDVSAVEKKALPQQKKGVLKAATAKALLKKADLLQKKAHALKDRAFAKSFKDYGNLKAAEAKQKAILDKLKHETNLEAEKADYQKQLAKAKAMSSKSIAELKKAGRMIKMSKMLPDSKAAQKMASKSEDLTEKAVHTMLKSRQLSHQASNNIKEARAITAQLPALQTKGREAKLVLKVLQDKEKQARDSIASSNPSYRKAVSQSEEMRKEAAKDRLLAKGLMKQEAEAKARTEKRVSRARRETKQEITMDRKAAKELHALRSQLSAQKGFIEKDDAILNALKH